MGCPAARLPRRKALHAGRNDIWESRFTQPHPTPPASIHGCHPRGLKTPLAEACSLLRPAWTAVRLLRGGASCRRGKQACILQGPQKPPSETGPQGFRGESQDLGSLPDPRRGLTSRIPTGDPVVAPRLDWGLQKSSPASPRLSTTTQELLHRRPPFTCCPGAPRAS